MDAEELVRRSRHGERDFPGVGLEGADFTDTNLTNDGSIDVDLSGSNLSNVNLGETYIKGVNRSGSIRTDSPKS